MTKYGVPDLLNEGGPKTAEEIVAKLHVHPELFPRLLRAAYNYGILARDPETLKYSLTDVSRLVLGIGEG